MAIQFIRKSYTFEEDDPGVVTKRIDFAGDIVEKQATVVLSGFFARYPGDEEHNVKLLRVRLLKVTPEKSWIDFDVDFSFYDDGDHFGIATVNVVAIADIKD